VAHAFHHHGVVDRYVVYLAPAFFGGDDATPMFAGPGASTMEGYGGAGWSRSSDWATTSGSNWKRHESRGKSGDMEIAKVEEAIAAIGRGEIVIVVDDEDRRTRATWSWPPRPPPPRRSPSSWPTPRGDLHPLTADRADQLELPSW